VFVIYEYDKIEIFYCMMDIEIPFVGGVLRKNLRAKLEDLPSLDWRLTFRRDRSLILIDC